MCISDQTPRSPVALGPICSPPNSSYTLLPGATDHHPPLGSTRLPWEPRPSGSPLRPPGPSSGPTHIPRHPAHREPRAGGSMEEEKKPT